MDSDTIVQAVDGIERLLAVAEELADPLHRQAAEAVRAAELHHDLRQGP